MRKKKEQAIITHVAAHDIFGNFRFFKKDNGEILFVGKDVAEILGYKDTDKAIRDHVDAEDQELLKPADLAGLKIPNRGLIFINESGLYSLIFGSQLPEAKKFTRWVTSEVLPSIRKTGSYSLPRKSLPEKKVITQEEILKKFFELYPDAEPEITDISFSEDENGNVITHYHVGYKLPDGNFIDPEKAAEKIFHM